MKLKTTPTLSSSLPHHENNSWNQNRCCVNCLIPLGKLFLPISNCSTFPLVLRGCFWWKKCFWGQGRYRLWQKCLGARDHPYPQKWGSNYTLNISMVNPKFLCHTPFVQPTKVTMKLSSLNHLRPLRQWKIVLNSSFRFQMNIPPCGVELNTFEIRMQKHVHINYTNIYPDFIFGLRYQQQVIDLMGFGAVLVLLLYRLT